MKAKDVPSYIAAQSPEAQKTLRKLRGVIRKALPKAEEVISYQIPMYRVDGKMVIFFAGWAKHYSLYPAGTHIAEKLGKALDGYKIAKGTIRFPYDAPMPVKLIETIVRLRLKDVKEGVSVAGSKIKAKKRKTVRKRTA